MRRLTDSQIHDFNENGYLLVEDALSADDLNPLVTEFENIVDTGASQLYADGEIDSEFKGEGFDTRLAQINVSNQVRWSVDSRYQDAAKPTGYQPEAGFLARSRLHPENVVTTPAEFKRVRDEHQPGPGPNRWAKEKEDA